MELQEVKNRILKNNNTMKFKYSETNLAKFLKINILETRKHVRQMLNDGFIQIKGDYVYITNNEELKIRKEEVPKYYVICANCVHCVNKRYFNRVIDNRKYHCVSCFCSLRKQRITELKECNDYYPR